MNQLLGVFYALELFWDRSDKSIKHQIFCERMYLYKMHYISILCLNEWATVRRISVVISLNGAI